MIINKMKSDDLQVMMSKYLLEKKWNYMIELLVFGNKKQKLLKVVQAMIINL
jgi:hypothetical protein